MPYVITSLDTSASGYAGKGVVCPTFMVSALADLAEDSVILNAHAGSKYILAGTPTTYGYKNPLNSQWILPAATPILITAQPADVDTVAGNITESVSVAAYAQDGANTYTPTYQWYSNSTETTDDATVIADATAAAYVIPGETAQGTIYYYCVITANSDNSDKTLQTRYAKVVVAAAPGA